MNNQYTIPATQTDPACLTAEGQELADQIEFLTDIAESANTLAYDLESNYPDDSKVVQELSDKLKAEARNLQDKLDAE